MSRLLSPRKKITLFALLIVISCGIYFAHQSSYLSFAYFNQKKDELLYLVQTNELRASLIFIGLYILVTLFTPGAAMFSLAGGFLFGVLKATAFIVLAATISGSITFLIMRYLLGNAIQQKYALRLKNFNHELHHYGSYYLLMVRVIPVFPFFLVNSLIGLTKIPLTTFAWTTAIGIIPGTLIYTFAGKQIGTINSPRDILSLPLLFALICLGLLALIPVFIKKRQKSL